MSWRMIASWLGRSILPILLVFLFILLCAGCCCWRTGKFRLGKNDLNGSNLVILIFLMSFPSLHHLMMNHYWHQSF